MNDILVEDGIALYLMLLPRRNMLALRRRDHQPEPSLLSSNVIFLLLRK